MDVKGGGKLDHDSQLSAGQSAHPVHCTSAFYNPLSQKKYPTGDTGTERTATRNQRRNAKERHSDFCHHQNMKINHTSRKAMILTLIAIILVSGIATFTGRNLPVTTSIIFIIGALTMGILMVLGKHQPPSPRDD